MPRRRTRLTTIGHVLTELGRVYRAASVGEMEWSDAGTAARVLREIRHCLEAADIEQRLAVVEQTIAEARRRTGLTRHGGNGAGAWPWPQ